MTATISEVDHLIYQDALECLQSDEIKLTDAAIILGLDLVLANVPNTDFMHPQLFVEIRMQQSAGVDSVVTVLERILQTATVDRILVPICHRDHWCLLVIDLRMRVISHYDSAKKSCAGAVYVIQRLRRALVFMFPETKNAWQRVNPDVPLQKNEIDCGLFLLSFAECVVGHRIIEAIDPETLRQYWCVRFTESGPRPVLARIFQIE